MEENKSIFDISKRQRFSFNAAVENVKSANNAIKLSQNWLWSLGIAELSFLGVVIFKDSSGIDSLVCFIKALVIVLLLSFVSFILASVLQYKHALKAARNHESISKRAYEYLRDAAYLENEPSDLKLPDKQITTGRAVNLFFLSSYILTISATIGIIIFILIWK